MLLQGILVRWIEGDDASSVYGFAFTFAGLVSTLASFNSTCALNPLCKAHLLFPISNWCSQSPCCCCLQGQVITGLLEYQRKNTFASNAFLCYGFFWLGTALNGTMRLAGLWNASPKGNQMAVRAP